MNVNVDAVLIVSGMIFATTMGGLGGLWLLHRRDNRALRERLERSRR